MLRYVTMFAALALVTSAPNPTNIFQIDLSPEEAQKYLNNPPFTDTQLAPRTAVLPLVRYDDPRFRAAEAGPTLGHYWKNGKEIENTNDYVESVYNAAQFHGQDGLGAYKYGYKTPESAKVENRVGSGDVTGSYTYKAGNNELIKVRYWADSQGFHQEDNVPRVQPQPVEEAPEVRAARLAHEKAWKEAADINLHPARYLQQQQQLANPQGQYYQNDYQPAASEQQASIIPAPSQDYQNNQARQGKAYYPGQSGQQYVTPQPDGKYEEPEPTGPPRGFFYSFEYPVSIINSKDEEQANANQGYQEGPYDSVSVSGGRRNY